MAEGGPSEMGGNESFPLSKPTLTTVAMGTWTENVRQVDTKEVTRANKKRADLVRKMVGRDKLCHECCSVEYQGVSERTSQIMIIELFSLAGLILKFFQLLSAPSILLSCLASSLFPFPFQAFWKINFKGTGNLQII